MMRPLSFARRLAGDRRGVTAIEFAILAPVMLTLLCGALELGHMIFARQVLEGAMVDAARKATASMESTEAERKTAMETTIKDQMADFKTTPGKVISIETKVYADFNSVTPEVFVDTDKDGKYDLGEPYVDRNKNGKWDNSTPKTGTMGNPGDVIAYTVSFPKLGLFKFVTDTFGYADGTIPLAATTVVRNEATVRSGT